MLFGCVAVCVRWGRMWRSLLQRVGECFLAAVGLRCPAWWGLVVTPTAVVLVRLGRWEWLLKSGGGGMQSSRLDKLETSSSLSESRGGEVRGPWCNPPLWGCFEAAVWRWGRSCREDEGVLRVCCFTWLMSCCGAGGGGATGTAWRVSRCCGGALRYGFLAGAVLVILDLIPSFLTSCLSRCQSCQEKKS